jgi:hypothetical protein
MSAIGGPNIVEDGLVVALDAANEKSFSGEPTVNLVNNPIFDGSIGASPTGWGSAGTSSIRRLTQSTLFPNFNAWECEVTLNNTTASITRSLPTLTGGQTYTFSIWVEEFNYLGGNFPIISLFNTTISSGFRSIGRTGISNEQPTITTSTIIKNQRIDFTFTVSTTTTSAFVRIGTPHTSSGGYLRVSKIQLEQKPYPTPWVNGTRGTTVATGGGWADRSGNSNHGELVNNPTFKNTGLGGLIFSGTNDSITIPFNSSTMDFSQAQTIFMWLRPGTGSDSARRNPYNQAYGGSGTITHEPARTFNYFFGTNGGNAQPYAGRNSGFTVAPNELACITVTRSQPLNLCRWYKNGVPGTFNTAGGYTATNNGNSPILIANGYTSRFIGDIYYIAVYNRYMTQEEVLQNYNATKGRFGL